MCSALRVMRYALCVLATPLAAQSAQQWRDSAERLAASVRLLRDSMLQGDSTVREVAGRGDMGNGASQALRGEAATAFERFTLMRQRWFGNAAPSDDGFRIVVRHGVPIPSRPGESEWSTVILAGLPDTGRSVRSQRMVQGKEITEGLIDAFGSMMWASEGDSRSRALAIALPCNEPNRGALKPLPHSAAADGPADEARSGDGVASSSVTRPAQARASGHRFPPRAFAGGAANRLISSGVCQKNGASGRYE